MGNSLACCGKSDSDPNNLDTNFNKDFQHPNKMRYIIKIQAVMRGYLTRKHVQILRG